MLCHVQQLRNKEKQTFLQKYAIASVSKWFIQKILKTLRNFEIWNLYKQFWDGTNYKK